MLQFEITFTRAVKKLLGQSFPLASFNFDGIVDQVENLISRAGYNKERVTFRWNPYGDNKNFVLYDNGAAPVFIAEFVLTETVSARLSTPTESDN